MQAQKIQDIVVLMLENRSFDHMLGYLEYPPEISFEGLRGQEQAAGNLLDDGGFAFPEQNAEFLMDLGPNHSHDAVMTQLLGRIIVLFPTR